ncbi:hypothetical protein UFOVP109_5 [uncultured Caudovirales phage]|uniref:Uncharacterized protein n=1 Tax=uncultured Caudovirales phage TaxID=2100421 RepID=A0A6J5L5M8_9CAUD|nr:hypothetical protein UFOVP109_5 [uncultured Caudovirales phage]CAB5218999.1 hypothetical protein UFOVP224_18 [uncultured Caudovirales phage]
MTTTAFQYIFDRAQTITVDRRAVTAQTITRDSTVRTVSRGGQVWRFTVAMPPQPWAQARPYIEAIDAAGRTTAGTVQIRQAGQAWIAGYQGDGGTFTGNWTQGGTTVTLTAGTAPTYKFRAGDFVQLGSTGRVYTITTDVATAANTAPVNRPIIDATGSGNLIVGSNVTWTVYCTELPTWTIQPGQLVAWSGAFVFYEALV